MFYLYNSNRTERLAETLAGIIHATGSENPFEQTPFLVQNREIKRLLSQHLADTFGIWGNARYLLPLSFISYVCDKLGIDHDSSAFDRAVLVWRLERLLRDLDDPALTPLRSYLDGDQSAVKRYQLARQVADLFDQYQIMRPAMTGTWDRGRAVTNNSAELWQRRLWQKLRGEGCGENRAEVIESLINRLDSHHSEPPDGLKKIFVFGLHTLQPMFLSVLKSLSRVSDIHFFLLTPCAQYWGDMETARQRLRKEKDLELDVDLAAYHPLLAGLGRQGADFQELLLSQVEEIDDGPELFVVNAMQNNNTLLHRLQDDLLDARYEPQVIPASISPDDDSLVVASCHSRMRETAVLRDYILKWLHEDPALSLHDIVVMAPDIQLYRDFIAATFSDITHDISDCRTRRDNRYVEIFSRFLKLLTSRYEAADILGLLDQPEVGRTFSISVSDHELITHWVRAAGIRWGLSEEQRQDDLSLGFNDGTWISGLERLLFGLASGARAPIDNQVPYIDIEGKDAELLGSLLLFLELVDQCRRSTRLSRSLADWSSLFHDMITGLFGDSDSAEYLQLQEICSSLSRKFAAHHEEPVSFDVVRQWFDSEADKISSVGFLRGRLTFCSMLPMRSIPFQVICLLGLNDREFPRQDRIIPFDLLVGTYEKGDRSKRADDRYQFLEAILAARKRLYLSFVGQSIRSNEPIPPSPVISELLEAVEHCYGPVEVVEHPLQPFNEVYFTGDSKLVSHSHYHCMTARSLRNRPAYQPGPWLEDPLEPLEHAYHQSVNLQDLERFVANPQRCFVQDILNIKLRTTEDILPADEPFGLEGLERYLLDQVLIEKMVAGYDRDALFAELQQELLWPLGFPGRNLFAEASVDISDFICRIREIDPNLRFDHLDLELSVDPYQVFGVIEHFSDNGLLLYRYGQMKGGDLMRGWLLHLIAGAAELRRGPTRIVAKDEMITIGDAVGDENDLRRLIDLYSRSLSYPVPFYVEPAFCYGRQILKNRGRGRKDPLQVAVAACRRSIDLGYSPELMTLFREPQADILLDEQFRDLADQIMVPILEQAEIGSFG